MQEIMVAQRLEEMGLEELNELIMRFREENPEAFEELKEILDDIII